MSSINLPDHIIELMSTYLSRNASTEQISALEQWVEEDSEHKQAFIDFKKSWMLASLNVESEMDMEKEWQSISSMMEPEVKTIPLKSKRNNRRTWLAIAASMLMLLGAAMWIFNQPLTNSVDHFAQTKDVPSKNSLPDGSSYELNKFSTLSYAYDKKKSQRISKLDGDAFFDVKRDEANPFIIHANKAVIEVLGTSFYVDARKEISTLQVIVNSGSVSVQVNSNKVILKAGEQANFDKSSGRLITQQNTDQNYRSFMNKHLAFDNTTLSEVVFAINRQYHTELTIVDDAIKNCAITASYTNKSLEALIEILQATLEITIEKNGNSYMIKGTGC